MAKANRDGLVVDRRGFFRRMGLGAAAVAVASKVGIDKAAKAEIPEEGHHYKLPDQWEFRDGDFSAISTNMMASATCVSRDTIRWRCINDDYDDED